MKDTKISATQVSLPKGGGAIQGIGETFQSDEFTGTAALSVPIPSSPCRGFEPNLSVEYSSGAGNGIFGLGFGLSIPNVSRKTSKGIPKYDELDTFLISNAEDLVPVHGGQRNETVNSTTYQVTAYQPRLEGLFARIEHWWATDKDSYWRVTSKDNVTSIFGKDKSSRIFDPEDPSHIFQWLLSETFDAKGDRIVYEYESENNDNVPDAIYEVNRTQSANKYIKTIKYGNVQPFQEGQPTQEDNWLFEVVFDYGEYNLDATNTKPYTPVQKWPSRKDPFSTYHAGFEIRTHRLCRSVLMFHRFAELGNDPVLVHATQFAYDEDCHLTLLTAVTSTGYRYENGKYQTKSLPPLEFKYTAFQPDTQTFEPLLGENGQSLPGLDLSSDYLLIDLYGEGIPGILYNDGRTTLYWEPEGDGNVQGTSTCYAPPLVPLTLPIESDRQRINQRLMDLTGDGQLDLVVSTPASTGYYEVNPDRTWNNFQTFPAFPNDFSNPNNYLVDVTGDGLADILLVESDRILVYPSLGKDGFGAATICPRENGLPLSREGAANEVLRFADLLGSGQQHLVRITNDKVECWPNLGYGRFDKPVQLGNAPHFDGDLDASRLFLADLDGSGTADLIYVYPDRVEVFFNQSGNSFSNPVAIALPNNSKWDRLNQIEFADIHGNGTTCLVFSETHPQPRHWCYDFSGTQKPYLLNEIDNNLGAKSTIAYSSSTKFYLADKKKGTPWIVNLPFPVLVVEKTESFDLISQTKLVSTYSYHHGFYDGIEREFRGFGMVERQDAETLSADAQPTDVPPVLTKTWYHTGAWQQDGSLSRQYESEYFQGDTQAYLLPDSVVDYSVNAGSESDDDARREAFRALKGTVLRQEVYGLDNSPVESNPYSVTETNYLVKLLQVKGHNKYGVYFVNARESLSYDYERNPKDPRIQHEFVLKVDEFGHVLRSCSVTYGRRQVTGNELQEQLKLRVTAAENIPIDSREQGAYLLGVPQESKAYEIENLPLQAGEQYFTFSEVGDYLDRVIGTSSARLLGWQRHYYWDTDGNQTHPLGQVSPQALLARTEVAEFDPEQIKQVFTDILSQERLNDLLANEGKYQQYTDNLGANPYWWNPGLQESYLDAKQFFLPKATTDPYGNATTYGYDPYHLLPVKVTDALNNQTLVQKVDYQTLSPQQLQDINGNSAEVLVDPLGMVILTSHYGAENGQAAGFMQLKDYQWQATSSMGEIIANPKTYLQGAASYFYYDLFSWKDKGIPVHTVSLIAENYPAVGTPSAQIHITYSDGFGRLQQSTMKVEPGEAHVINSDGTVKLDTSSERWLTSGRTAFNNKGNPVKQYEPYYIATYQYVDNPHLNKFGVSPTLFYDPLQRAIRVDTPKGFFTQVEFTPWMERHYDANDTVKESTYYQQNISNSSPDFQWERQALQKAAAFDNTPDERVLDNLGRTIQDIQHKEDGTTLTTHYEWDIQGNQLSSSDPRLSVSNLVNFRMTYSMNGIALKTVSADAGTHWVLLNAIGNPIYAKDSRNFEFATEYDALHRPVAVRVIGGDNKTTLNQVVDRTIYGDSLDANGHNVVAEPEKGNLRGQLYRHYDQAGLVGSDAYNILGLPLVASRQFLKDYKQEANWDDISASTLASLLQPEVYTSSSEYDAIGRITKATNPDGNVYQPTYHQSGRLDRVQLDGDIYVQSIDYNPKGQRQTIVYGNGVTTQYVYEPTTFHLTQILTTRESDAKKLQDLNYTFDPVGNITHVTDKAWETVFNNNQQVAAESDYTYDALYRLIVATGREHPGLSLQSEQSSDFDDAWVMPLQPISNGQALQNYTRNFTYDDGGNLYSIQHHGATPRNRKLTISNASNRAVVSDLTEESGKVDSFFDGNGNQKQMWGLQGVTWNYRNNIASVTIIDRQGAPSDCEYYVYDSAGNRVRKVTESYGNGETMAHTEETIYLGAMEIKRIGQNGSIAEERHTLRVMDDASAVATRLNWKQGSPPDGVSNPQVRYQLGDHLGSAALEVDATGQIISYEEYFPYGGTAFVAGQSASEVKLKQYRYSGKERDSVTGFYYYGARYYAPWLGRWMSCDPAGTVDGLNLYAFVSGNPINHVDIGGLSGKGGKDKDNKEVIDLTEDDNNNNNNNNNNSKNEKKRFYSRDIEISRMKKQCQSQFTEIDVSEKWSTINESYTKSPGLVLKQGNNIIAHFRRGDDSTGVDPKNFLNKENAVAVTPGQQHGKKYVELTSFQDPTAGAISTIRFLKGSSKETHINDHDSLKSRELGANIGVSEFARAGEFAILEAIFVLYKIKYGLIQMSDFVKDKVGYIGVISAKKLRKMADNTTFHWQFVDNKKQDFKKLLDLKIKKKEEKYKDMKPNDFGMYKLERWKRKI